MKLAVRRKTQVYRKARSWMRREARAYPGITFTAVLVDKTGTEPYCFECRVDANGIVHTKAWHPQSGRKEKTR